MSDESRAHLSLLFDGLEGFVAMGIGFGGHRNGNGTYEFRSFSENFFVWPEQTDTIVDKALENRLIADVYVCPLLRRERSRKTGTGGVGRFAWADLDSDAPSGWHRALLGPSSFVVSSGHGLHPYLWLSEALPAAEIERVNKRFADALGADAGWSETKYLRLAGTLSHKQDPPLPVRFVELAGADRDWALAELEDVLPEHEATAGSVGEFEAREPILVSAHLLARLDEEVEDRSKASYSFVAGCLAAGLDEAETQWLALRHQPTVSKYGGRAGQEIGRTIGKVRETSVAGSNSSRSYARTAGGVETLSSSNSSNSRETGWPAPPAEAAFYGLAGSYVREIGPFTEADPVAVLLQVLTTLGNAIGRRPYVQVEADAATSHKPLLRADRRHREGSEGHESRTCAPSLVTRAARALDFARRVDGVKRDAPARALWAEHYERLATGRRGRWARFSREQRRTCSASRSSTRCSTSQTRSGSSIFVRRSRSGTSASTRSCMCSARAPEAGRGPDPARAPQHYARPHENRHFEPLRRNLSAGRIGRALAVLVEEKLATFAHEKTPAAPLSVGSPSLRNRRTDAKRPHHAVFSANRTPAKTTPGGRGGPESAFNHTLPRL